MAFNAFFVQSPVFNLDETVITSFGNEKSLSMLIWVLYGQTAKFETGGNCRMSSMYIKNIPIEGNLLERLTLKDFCEIVFCSDCTLGDGRDIDFSTVYFLLLLLLLARMLRKVCQTASINY